jgi:hypothetical protein
LPAGVSQESLDLCTKQINEQSQPVHVYSESATCKSFFPYLDVANC